jgi:hypothetical protein
VAAPAMIPVQLATDALARVDELQMQRQFEAMLEHTKQSVPDLQTIEVTLYRDPHEPDEPRIHITAIKAGPSSPNDPTWDNWGHWFVRAFPPEVCRWFGFDVDYRDDHGR